MILWVIVIILFFILVEAFFSGSEMGVISVNRIKMEQLAQSNVSQAVLLKKMLSSPDMLLSTTLVGTNVSVVISSALCTTAIVGILGQGYTWLVPVIMTPIILIFAEAIPKAVFRYYADGLTFKVVRILRFFEIIFWPVVIVVTFISRVLLFPFNAGKKRKKSLFVTREELKFLIRDSKKDTEIKPHERAMIHRIFEFGSKKVKEIMIPTQDVVSIETGDDLNGLKKVAKASGYSRILIYQESKNNFIGFANVFDALYEEGKFEKALDCLRPVLYISQETPIDKVFYLLQLKRMQIAVLLNTNNQHVGIVTFKDLLDEIAGEL